MLLYLSVILSVCTLSSAFLPSITIHTSIDETGDSVTLRTKHSDVRPIAPTIIPNLRRNCFTGTWVHYKEVNFTNSIYLSGSNPFIPLCYNGTNADVRSIRFLGPSNYDLDAISFYSGVLWAGEEVIVTGTEHANLIPPRSLFAIGGSFWTLYTGINFDGTSTCLELFDNYLQLASINDPTLLATRSVRKGCAGSIERHIKLSTKVGTRNGPIKI